MSRPLRLAVLLSHPVQYVAPLFRRLADEPSLDVTVLYCSRLGTSSSDLSMLNFDRTVVWDVDLLDGYRSKFLRSPVPPDPQRRWSLANLEICTELTRGRYDAIVNYGWAYPVDWLSFLNSRVLRIPFLLHGDTDVRDPGSQRTRVARLLALRWLCRRAAGALYTGTFNRDFYIRNGMHPERLWFSPLAVEQERFARQDRAHAREALGLEDDVCYFLFVGTLLERKCTDLLASAVADLQQRGYRVGLIVAGSGPREEELRRTVSRLGMRDVHLLGFVNQSELPLIYAAGDVFVLPSRRDPRALVVNEAMSAGLPIVISTGTGHWAPGDLVRDGREALVFPVGDFVALRDACLRLTDAGLRAQIGAAASVRIARWSYEVAAAGWLAAVHAVARGKTWPGSPTRSRPSTSSETLANPKFSKGPGSRP